MDLPGPAIVDHIVAIVLVVTVLVPVLTLVHELGHGVAALRVSEGPVHVQVGRPPAQLEFRLGRIIVSFSALPSRGGPFAGLCLFQRTSRSVLGELVLLLAGPAMSILAAGLLAALAVVAVTSAPWWVTLTLTYGALQAFVAFLYNIDPRPASKAERARAEVRRDGPKVLRCYRLWRAGGVMTIVTPQTAPMTAEAASANRHSLAVPPGQG
jgi:hypothetical protein